MPLSVALSLSLYFKRYIYVYIYTYIHTCIHLKEPSSGRQRHKDEPHGTRVEGANMPGVVKALEPRNTGPARCGY